MNITQEPLVYVLILLGSILAIGAYALSRRVFVDQHQAYLYRRPLGELRQLESTKILWNPLSRLERFKGQEPCISCWNQDLNDGGGQWMQQSLVLGNGRLSLAPYCCDATPFFARTLDRHMMRVSASATVRLRREDAIHYLSRGDIGKLFADRLTQVYREQIGRFNDEELRANHDEVIAAVTELLLRAEQDPKTALGLDLVQTRFFADDADMGQSTMAPTPMGAAAQTAGATPNGSGGNTLPAQVNSMPGAMQYSDLHLDHIADKFSNRPANETAALMRLIELQTRQNIVQMISQSNGLVIFSASELDLDSKTQLSLAGQSAGRELEIPEAGLNIKRAIMQPASKSSGASDELEANDVSVETPDTASHSTDLNSIAQS